MGIGTTPSCQNHPICNINFRAVPYATNLLNAGAELVDIQALLEHSTLNTMQIYTNVGQERMEKVMARL